MQSRWLRPETFLWEWDIESCGESDSSDWKPAYSIWAHAAELLELPDAHSFCTDAIVTLKRALNQRLDFLNRKYHLKSLPIIGKSSGILQQLEMLGVVRSSMFIKLTDLRNAVEHKYEPPPNRERCREFLDFVWYFLKSTDLLAHREIDTLISHNPEDDHYWLTAGISPQDDWRVELSGWLPPSSLCSAPKEKWLQVNISDIESRCEFLQRIDPSEQELLGGDYDCRGRNPEDLYFSGTITGDRPKLKALFNAYFSQL